MEERKSQSKKLKKGKPKIDWPKMGRRIGTFIAFFGALSLALFAFGASLPIFALWLAIVVGISVLLSELMVYFRGNRTMMELLVSIGLVKDLENSLIIRELLKEYKDAESLKNDIDHLEKEIREDECFNPATAYPEAYGRLDKENKRIAFLKDKLSTEYERECYKEVDEEYLKYRLRKLLNRNYDSTSTSELFKSIQSLKERTRSEFRGKLVGLIIGAIIFVIPFALFSALISFMSILTIFSFVISSPILLFALAGTCAFFSFFAFGLLMMKTVHKDVKKNIFASLFNKVTELIIIKDWNKLGAGMRSLHIFKSALLLSIILGIVIISFLCTLSTCGAGIGVVAGFIALWHLVSSTLAFGISTYFASFTVFPLLLIFTIQNSIGVLHSIVLFCSHPLDSWNNFVSKLEVVETNSKWVRYLCYASVTLTALFLAFIFIFHCLGDGGISEEGDTCSQGWMIYLFNYGIKFLNQYILHTKESTEKQADYIGITANAAADLNFFAKDESINLMKKSVKATTKSIEMVEISTTYITCCLSNGKKPIEKSISSEEDQPRIQNFPTPHPSPTTESPLSHLTPSTPNPTF